MNHLGTTMLTTERLLLRRFTAEDSESAFRSFASDVNATKFLKWQAHTSPEETATLIGNWVRSYERRDFYLWAIVPKSEGKPIGYIGVLYANDAVGMFHTCYCIGSAWWGKGIVTEAYGEVLRYLFENVDANRIEASHDPRNPASGKVMQKCGLRYEGTLRQADISNMGITDIAIYSILREDFFARRNNNE